MSLSKTLLATAVAVSLALPAFAEKMNKIMVTDPYARSSTPTSKSGAAFMSIMNHTDQDDRLISASSDAAARVELHTHKEEDGIMMMLEVEEGFPIAAGETHMLQRGGDHVMLMGLKQPLVQGEMIDVTLTFEKAGQVQVQIPVDLERKPNHNGHADHNGHSDNM
ncbi:copper chaperone PCu(A)C [Parasulfitobacter algicola]|uniref:Copper chaperone PCu(A)C n=1 Tax=Parasulfitobacter algicola TaxID=2614809 RepID=A0ABX2IRC6_9RHOB|nr:copper chaperone PCu(A)C [Sulfitobacter algicola]NSX54566.1 copper chaperone PCu(A)C [Sulfitobacter algicola]